MKLYELADKCGSQINNGYDHIQLLLSATKNAHFHFLAGRKSPKGEIVSFTHDNMVIVNFGAVDVLAWCCAHGLECKSADKRQQQEEIKLWVDDVREPPEGWHWVKNFNSAVTALCIYNVVEMSLDYDLDIEQAEETSSGLLVAKNLEEAKTGLDVIEWLVTAVKQGLYPSPLPIVHCHSANPEGRKLIGFEIVELKGLKRSVGDHKNV